MGPVLTNLSWLWLPRWENLGVRQMKEKLWEVYTVNKHSKEIRISPRRTGVPSYGLQDSPVQLLRALEEAGLSQRWGCLIYAVLHLSFSHLCRQLPVYPCSSSVVTAPSYWRMGVYFTSISSVRFQVLALLFCNACYHKKKCYFSWHHFT